MSLNKYISSSGFCSRREADKLIEQARVTINGELVAFNVKLEPGDRVEVDGEPLRPGTKKRPIYIAFNKPVGVTSTTDVKDKSNIIYYIGHSKRIFPIGRLDKDSDGLIFLTNDGDIVNKILRASNFHEKEYIVTVDKAITPEFIKQMSSGVPVLGEMTRKCFVRQEGGRRFRIILTQGLNRQIRRMCEYLGYDVQELRRVRIMNIELGNLPLGKWRYFTAPEIDKLNEMVAQSGKTEHTKDRLKGKEKPKEEDRALVQYIPKKRTGAEDRRTVESGRAESGGGRKDDKHVKTKSENKRPPVAGKNTGSDVRKPKATTKDANADGRKPKTVGKFAEFRKKGKTRGRK